MAGRAWKATKIVLATGATIAVVGAFAGAQQTADVVPVAVDRTFWGLGVGTAGVKYAGPGFARGYNQGSPPEAFTGLGNDLGANAGKNTVKELCAVTPKPSGCA